MRQGSPSILIRCLLAAVLLGASLLAAPIGASSTSAQVVPTATATVEPAPADEPASGETNGGRLTPADRSPPDEDDQADGATYDERDDERDRQDDDDGRGGQDDDDDDGRGGPGGGKNVVKLNNRQDGRLRVRGNVQLARIKGNVVEPVNLAYARGSCVGCNTFAVALQIALYRPGANQITPLNLAVALNEQCRGCKTVARAVQFVIPVEDPNWAPEHVNELIRELDRELKEVHRDSDTLTVEQAEARINTVIDRFRHLAQSLKDERDEEIAEDSPQLPPTATPTPATEPSGGITDIPATPTPTPDPNAPPATTPTPTSGVQAPTPTVPATATSVP